ncbi:MAG: glycosyltransferase family 9 protein [Holophagaceae bacterium]|nr:glycosyltransferase family 9 protein [Holophagaceae bacterium]
MSPAIPDQAVWVRLPRFIGDSVMIAQALEPLRRAGRPLVAWGPAFVCELFEGSEAFAAVVPDPPRKPGSWAMAKLLKAHRCSAVVNFPRSQRALAGAFLARAPIRAGWREGGGALLATHHLPFRTTLGHQVERYRALLAKAFPGTEPCEPAPFTPRPDAFAEADRLLAEAGVAKPFVALCLGAMSWNKRLGTAAWTDLAVSLRSRGEAVALLGGAGDDEAQAAEIRKKLPELPDFTGRAALSTGAALLGRAKAAVANDSALAHLAAAVGTPVAVAYGPTDPAVTRPWSDAVAIVRREDLACIGCMGPGCPVPGRPCLEDLGAERILAALGAWLG